MDQALVKKKNLELKKHVGAIHSNNSLTLLQRKIANALLYNAYDDLFSNEEHRIHIADLCKIIGYDSKDHKKIKQSLIKLISTVIEWNLVDKSNVEDEGVWNASSIIADASIEGPVCSYSYSKRMRELLYHPEMYGRLNMKVQAKFKSSYGLALYENCIRYQNIAQTPWFEYETFRKLMGVEEGKYTIFRDFKRRVIDKAIEEVNRHSPIRVSVNYKKEGRKLVALQFHISKQNELDAVAHEDSSLSEILIERYGFSKHQAIELSERYEEGYILEKISIIESSNSFKSGKIAKLSRYLEKALEEDYQAPKSSKEVVLQDDLQQQQKKKWLTDYEQYLNAEIIKAYQDYCVNNPSAAEAINKDFDHYIKGDILFGLYEKEGIFNVLVKDKLVRFIKKYHGYLTNKCLSFEEYCQQFKMHTTA